MARRGGAETHRLILEFLVKGRVEQRLSTITKHLRATNKEAAALLKTLDKLNAKMSRGRAAGENRASAPGKRAARDEARSAREVARIHQQTTRQAIAQDRLRERSARQLAAVQTREARRSATETLRLMRSADRAEHTRSRTARARRPQRRDYDYDNIDRFNRGVRTARNVSYVARAAYDTVKTGFVDPALELKRAQTRFQLLGHSLADQAKGLQAVDEVTQQLKGVRKVDATELLSNLTNTMGSVDEAVALLPQASKFLAATEALNGQRVGRDEAIKAFSDAAKAVELLGKDIDTKTAKQYLNLIAQSNLATGGEVNPAELRNFIKQGQIVGMQMSPEGLAKFLPLVQQMGGKAAGTALTSLYSSVVGGQIPAHKLRYWQDMGLVDKSKVEYGKQGQIKRFLPGAIPIAEGMGQDPFLFTDKLMAAFDKKGIDTTNVESVSKQLETMFGNRTAKREVAQMMLMRRQLSKETANYMRVPDIEGFYSTMFESGNVLGKYLDFTASQTNLRATGGKQAAELGGSIAEQLSRAIKSLEASSGESSVYATAAIGILSLGRASAEAADGVGLFNGMLRGGSGGGGGLGGESSTGILSGAASLLGRGAYGLWGLAANPIGLSIIGTVGAAYASYQKTQAFKRQKSVETGAAGDYATLTQKRARGEAVDYTSSARAVREALARGGELSAVKGNFTARIFEPGATRSLSTSLYGDQTLPVDRELLRRFAPQLAVPEVREGFYRTEMPQLGLSKEGQANLQRAIESVFANVQLPGNLSPGAQPGGSVMGGLVQSILSIADPSKQAAEALSKNVDPATKLAPALNSSVTAAQNFANRVNAIELQPPSFPAFPVPGAVSPPASSSAQPGANRLPSLSPGKYIAPGSAIGSIVKSDGLIEAHKGNVIFPSALSRRSPGDWLRSVEGLQNASELQKLIVINRTLDAEKKRRSEIFSPSAPSSPAPVSLINRFQQAINVQPRQAAAPQLASVISKNIAQQFNYTRAIDADRRRQPLQAAIAGRPGRDTRSPFERRIQPVIYPSKAKGGIVERTGFVRVHERESIVPAVVTDRWRDRDFPGLQQTLAPRITVNVMSGNKGIIARPAPSVVSSSSVLQQLIDVRRESRERIMQPASLIPSAAAAASSLAPPVQQFYYMNALDADKKREQGMPTLSAWPREVERLKSVTVNAERDRERFAAPAPSSSLTQFIAPARAADRRRSQALMLPERSDRAQSFTPPASSQVNIFIKEGDKINNFARAARALDVDRRRINPAPSASPSSPSSVPPALNVDSKSLVSMMSLNKSLTSNNQRFFSTATTISTGRRMSGQAMPLMAARDAGARISIIPSADLDATGKFSRMAQAANADRQRSSQALSLMPARDAVTQIGAARIPPAPAPALTLNMPMSRALDADRKRSDQLMPPARGFDELIAPKSEAGKFAEMNRALRADRQRNSLAMRLLPRDADARSLAVRTPGAVARAEYVTAAAPVGRAAQGSGVYIHSPTTIHLTLQGNAKPEDARKLMAELQAALDERDERLKEEIEAQMYYRAERDEERS